MPTQRTDVTTGLTTQIGNVDVEPNAIDTIILVTNDNGAAIYGYNGAKMTFQADGSNDTLVAQGSTNPAAYTVVFTDNGASTTNLVDALTHPPGSLNGTTISVNNFITNDTFQVKGFNQATGSTVVPVGSSLHFANVNGSSFVVYFNGVSANVLADYFTNHGSQIPGTALWSMTATQGAGGGQVGGQGDMVTDAKGNVWKINNGRVNVNGVDDPTTGRVVHLAHSGGRVYQENADNLWWSKASPTDQWTPPEGTSATPGTASLATSTDGTTVTNDFQKIIDAAQNTWSIANGQVDVNGHLDPTTKNVIELAYKNGAVWQENSDHLWWMKTSPSDQWSPTYGTPNSPV